MTESPLTRATGTPTPKRVLKAVPEPPPAPKRLKRDTMLVSDVVDTGPIQWLWQGYLPKGMVVGLIGDGDMGKSHITLDLAARVSAGLPMPDGTPGVKGRVLILTNEDSPLIIQKRLMAMGANTSRVHIQQMDDVWVFPRDSMRLKQLIRREDIRLVIFDPIKAFCPSVIDKSEVSVRSCIGPLTRVAMATGATMIPLRHITKQGGKSAGMMGAGSAAWRNSVRGEFAVGLDPDDTSRRLLACDKMNVAPKPDTLAYRIRSVGEVAVIDWDGVSPHCADELFTSHQRAQRRNDVEDWLRNHLANGPRPSRQTLVAALALGHTEATYKRARTALGILSTKTKDGWVLSLPTVKALTSGN